MKNLEGYVRDGRSRHLSRSEGRSVAYNKLLYRDGEGLFPRFWRHEATKPPTDEEKTLERAH